MSDVEGAAVTPTRRVSLSTGQAAAAGARVSDIPVSLTFAKRAGLNLNQTFNLAELPSDLAAVLAEFDENDDGTVTLHELAMGAHLLRSAHKKHRTFVRIIIALVVVLLLQLAGNFGLVWSVVAGAPIPASHVSLKKQKSAWALRARPRA